ncbi:MULTISPECIES: dTDP-4-dehydrorhamnose reductase [unclassified Alcanivorax]|jgi:dTDP-4-dehydrorhamnose reductase|uniref:dTDP-4-dehydrorhamnose reductase n=1 Tax=Alcanivorax TaxID=59753 RepID=UPI002356999E|nr:MULTISPECIES: dTDP-4-dehydrorhamnose reductase [unclassified Alcanivorax]
MARMRPLNILLLGKNGQVGWELQRSLAPLGKVTALDRFGQDSLCGDISNMDGLRHTIDTVKPDILVNAAAYTAVDKAEDEPELAIRLNTEAPVVMAKAMQALGGCLVHYSTDYVFDGSGTTPWKEADEVGPLSVYGASKMAAESAIQETGCHHLIFRTSWVYASRGNNFAKTMLWLAKERETLNVINDQIGAPTGADLIADVTAHALRQWQRQPQTAGLYHLAASGETSWHQYANVVIQWAQKAGIPLAVQSVNPIPSEEYPVPAERPKNSRLDCQVLESTFGLQLPPWQQGVERMLQEITNKEAL